MSLPVAYTLKVDFTGTPLGSAPTWTTVPMLLSPTQGGGQGSVTDGRQDESSDVNPAQLTEVLIDNRSGDYTPGLASGAHYPYVKAGARVKLQIIIDGTTVDYYDGLADSFSTATPVNGLGVTTVAATDILGRFGAQQPLRGIVTENAVTTDPLFYATLTDDSAAVAPAPLILPSGCALKLKQKGVGGGFSFGATGIPADTSGGLTLGPTGATTGWYVELTGDPGVDSGFVMGVWVLIAPTVTSGTLMAFQVQGGGNGAEVSLASNGTLSYLGPESFTTTPVVNDNAWHFILVTNMTGSANLYVDGQLAGSTSPGVTVTPITTYRLGAGFAPLNLLPATYAHWGIWTADPGGLYQAGATGFAGESTATHLARLLSYRANYGATDSGLFAGPYSGLAGLHDLGGVSLQQAIFATAHVEGAPVYADGDGLVSMLPRSALQVPPSTVAVDGTQGQIQQDLDVLADNQQLLNSYAVTGSDGVAQTYQDVASQMTYGVFDDSLTAPFNTDADSLAAAQWAVNSRKDSTEGADTLTVDIYALAAWNPSLAVEFLEARIGSWITFTNMPSPFPANPVVVQGRQLSFDAQTCSIEFYTTAAEVPPVLFWNDGQDWSAGLAWAY